MNLLILDAGHSFDTKGKNNAKDRGVKSGVLNPKVTLKVKNGIGNVVTLLQNKVAMLEDLVNKLIQSK